MSNWSRTFWVSLGRPPKTRKRAMCQLHDRPLYAAGFPVTTRHACVGCALERLAEPHQGRGGGDASENR